MKQICIASMTKPTNVTLFFNDVRKTIPECSAAVFAPGYGCNNYGFTLNVDDAQADSIANQLTMALMPARYSDATNDPLLIEGCFYDATIELGDYVAMQVYGEQSGFDQEKITKLQIHARSKNAPLDALHESPIDIDEGWWKVSQMKPDHPFIAAYNEAMIKRSQS